MSSKQESEANEVNALELRLTGETYRQIAVTLGYAGPAGAYKAVQAALKKYGREMAEDVRALELARLDELLGAQWPGAMDGDVQAGNLVLKIMDRRAKFLGLDQHLMVDVTERVRELADALGLDADDAVRIAEQIIARRQ